MKGEYGGPVPVDDLFQALWQDREFFRQHNINHVRDVFLFFHPCDERGCPVIVRDAGGGRVGGYMSSGGYQCAASLYESPTLLPVPLFETVEP